MIEEIKIIVRSIQFELFRLIGFDFTTGTAGIGIAVCWLGGEFNDGNEFILAKARSIADLVQPFSNKTLSISSFGRPLARLSLT